MQHFETLMFTLSLIALAGSIAGVFLKAKNDIVRVQAQLVELRGLISINKDNYKDQRAENREDHRLLFDKLEEINRKL